jgi:mannose-1-phosphate guanylyltransferase/phosphomannomutase
MKSLLGNLPKCLAKIEGKTLLQHNIANFKSQGISKFHLLLGIGADVILDEVKFIASQERVTIDYTIENIPLGTGGAIINALPSLDETFFVVHGDLYVNTNLDQMRNAFFQDETLAAQIYHPSTHMQDSDLIGINESGFVSHYFLKTEDRPKEVRNFGNAGLYLFKRKVFEKYRSSVHRIDLDREFLPQALEDGLIVKAIRNLGYIKDVGTPERLKEVTLNFESIKKLSILRPAIFLDRDGTLNKELGYITSPHQIELYPDCVNLIKRVNELGFRVIVITNQPVIARGEANLEDLEKIHVRIDNLLANSGAFIDDYFYCPHHPDRGFEGENLVFKMDCSCRKPEVGLFMKAINVYPTSIGDSFMVGDTWRDIQAGKTFGLKTVFIDRQPAFQKIDVDPDFHLKNLDDLELRLN